MKYFINCVVVTLFIMGAKLSFGAAPVDFKQAKKVAAGVFSQHRSTLYCGCGYSSDKIIDLATCNMQSADGFSRSHRMEWEHMMPVSQFGKKRACWQQKLCTDNKGRAYGGRKCCEKIDKQFKVIEAELFNLWPANGYINASRSNYAYAQLYPLARVASHDYYGCPVVVNRVDHLFEPSDEAKGVVARAMLFMLEKHGVELDNETYNLMTYWHRRFPPRAWEVNWEQAIAKITGYHNPYISQA